LTIDITPKTKTIKNPINNNNPNKLYCWFKKNAVINVEYIG